MKKVFAVLLLITAVIGMALPGMANPSAKVDKVVNIDVDGTNLAKNSVDQTLISKGDQTNEALVVVLGGNADAKSKADADGNAKNSGDAEVEETDEDSFNAANAGNLLSGNAVALSDAKAIGGDADNGDIYQVNEVVQIAKADIDNKQILKQNVKVFENIKPEVEVNNSIFDNKVEIEDNKIELED